MLISLIAAMAHNRVIGKDNMMPWHLPADFAWFKRQTLHKPIVMGRRTYQSIGRPLPERLNIVLSRQTAKDEQVHWVHSWEEAITVAKAIKAKEIMVIGGSQLYQQCLPQADRLYLTHIDAELAGDTWFPDYSRYSWNTLFTESHQHDEKNVYDYRFEILERAD